MKIGMTKKVVTSLLLSTALLPMLSGKADTTATATKPSSATKESGATSTASKQVTLSAGSQTDTAATSSETQSASTASQATESTTTTSAASKSDAAATSATSRVTVRAASAATSQSAKADSTDQQNSSSEAAKQDETAASATAASTTSAVDKLDETAKASAATSQDSQATSDHANSAVTSSAAKSADSADSEAKSAEAKSAETKPAAEQATPKATPQVETAKVAATIQSPAVAARATRALTSQEIFLSQIKAGAVSGWNKYQVLPSVTAAQAILESGWGRSQLATAGNNLFGIKGSYQGQSIYFPTQEWNGSQYITIQDAFRKYPNWSASVEDHGAFLVENPRYSNLLGVTDYRRVASLLQQDGYATAPTYASSLISIIEYNQLHQLDQEVLNGQTNTGNNNNTQTLPDENVTVTSGTHKFTKTTTIHNSPDQNSASVGTYYAGETVNYNGKLTVNNATWLRYQSYSGVSRYVMISQATNNNNNNHENQATVTPASGSYKFTVKTNIRSAASKSATVVGTYNAGETVYYNGKVTTGGTTWLRYLSYSGAQHYVATSGDEVAPVNKPNVVATSGAYRFTNTTAIKNAPANNAATVGTYNAGDTVYYNGKVTTNGETWLRYLSYSGAQHYVAISGASSSSNTTSTPTNTTGAFRFVTTTNIRTAPTTRAGIVGQYNPGETVYYNGTVQAEGYTWLRYLSRSGATHYVAMIKN
ncbi:cell wall hydrolase [Lactiplantibacillus pentosus]|uniref:glucosaminidase domain-containing protein n=1 Tax=Lactiplantibacillus pentosus TaxID=1589 RepID=UPI000EA88B6E|nr:cell wall hydrolase [Lactiplantibacillus pentosus]AYG40693.1 cell wall hydrolase [Lactiplantibacillus pentosus]